MTDFVVWHLLVVCFSIYARTANVDYYYLGTNPLVTLNVRALVLIVEHVD